MPRKRKISVCDGKFIFCTDNSCLSVERTGHANSPVAEWMNLDKIANKLVYGSFEAEWCPETHNKNPPINSLGKIFYGQKFKMAAKLPKKCYIEP